MPGLIDRVYPLDCLRDNSLQPGFDWSTIRGIRDEDLYPLIFLFPAISVASLLARACWSSIDYYVQRHYTLSRDTYICIVYIAYWFLMKANLFNIFAWEIESLSSLLPAIVIFTSLHYS